MSLFETSFEVRRRIGTTPFGVVGFVDAGAVGRTLKPDFSDLSPSVGVGLRYALPFAPVRVDIATPLREPAGRSLPPIQVYISVGQSF